MTPEQYDKIDKYIQNINYFDAKENQYTEKNEFGILESFFGRKSNQKHDYNIPAYEVISKSGYIGVAWHIGGNSGGNCWQEIATPYTVEQPQVRDLYLLNEIIDQVSPNLTFKQYRSIMEKLDIQTDTTGNYEYYGNSTDYQVKYFAVKNLLDAFKELDVQIDEVFIDNMNTTFENKKNTVKKPKIK